MGSINTQALLGFVYLGESEDNSMISQVIHVMSHLYVISQWEQNYSLQDLRGMALSHPAPENAKEINYVLGFIELRDTEFPGGILPCDFNAAGLPVASFWHAFKMMFARAWFTRMLIIQGIILSRRTNVLLGRHCFPWKLLGTSTEILYTKYTILERMTDPNLEFNQAYMSGYEAAKTLVILQDAGRQTQLMHLL